MATTTVTPTQLSMNTGQEITQGTGTAIVAANTLSIAYPRHGKLLILIDSDHADTALTFAAGDMIAAGKGTLTVSVGDTKMKAVIIDSDRFVDSDGNVTGTWATNSAGYVQAYYLPTEA